jgi:hypothetical protein
MLLKRAEQAALERPANKGAKRMFGRRLDGDGRGDQWEEPPRQSPEPDHSALKVLNKNEHGQSSSPQWSKAGAWLMTGMGGFWPL